MTLSPQATRLLDYLKRQGSATQVEMEAVFKMRRLGARVFELKQAGHAIRSEFKKDVTGQRYVRYFLEAAA